MKRILAFTLMSIWMMGSCSDSNDPDTLNPEDLSPPLQLVTVTGNTSIELRWQGVNFEDELKGYDVFISEADKGISDLTAPSYPSGVDIAANQTIPYCVDNHTFFKQFGITAEPSADCEGAKSVPALTLVQDDETEGDGVVKAKVACYNPDSSTEAWGDSNISLATGSDKSYRKGVGIHRCLITKDRSGTALVNGKTYTFFVVAVTGDDYDGISWTSNFVNDTPAKPVVDNVSISLAAQKYVVINPDTTTIDTTLDVSSLTANSCGTQGLRSDICGVWGANSNAADGIYIARDNTSSTYPQRILISTSSNSAGTISLLHRGDKLRDPIAADGSITYRVPGDQAYDKSTYSSLYKKGSIFIVRDRQVYDLLIERTAGTYYGKIAFGDITTSTSGSATIPVTIVIQSKANSVHYFR